MEELFLLHLKSVRRDNSTLKQFGTTRAASSLTQDGNFYPALNIMGGRRYMKNTSSSNIRMRELFPLVMNKIIIPEMHPYQGEC